MVATWALACMCVHRCLVRCTHQQQGQAVTFPVDWMGFFSLRQPALHESIQTCTYKANLPIALAGFIEMAAAPGEMSICANAFLILQPKTNRY